MQPTPDGNWFMTNYADGPDAGIFSWEIDEAGLGVWTIIATVCLVTGSWFLYGGASQLRPAWWVFLVVIGGTLLFMLGGMTAMVRARFSTPTVGREGMIGEDGIAEVAVDPDGVVLIRGARWRARTNRATPIKAGDPVKVVAVEGLVLEVEPPEGGAHDYRERARNRKAKRPPNNRLLMIMSASKIGEVCDYPSRERAGIEARGKLSPPE